MGAVSQPRTVKLLGIKNREDIEFRENPLLHSFPLYPLITSVFDPFLDLSNHEMPRILEINQAQHLNGIPLHPL
jgi:hypothetical protein